MNVIATLFVILLSFRDFIREFATSIKTAFIEKLFWWYIEICLTVYHLKINKINSTDYTYVSSIESSPVILSHTEFCRTLKFIVKISPKLHIVETNGV